MTESKVCLTFDLDAVSVWLHTFRKWNNSAAHSRGVFGAEVATPRLLDLLEEHDIPATWFIPGHTIESFPHVAAEVCDRGFDIQHHGWTHSDPGRYDSREEEQADIERAIDTIQDLTGRKPVGYRSPAGDFSEHTLEILEDLDFKYDSSHLGTDYEPYYLHKNWEAKEKEPYDKGEQTDVIEIPRSWQRNDFTALTFIPKPQLWGYADEDIIFKKWRNQFDWMHENLSNGVYVLINHPQCIGLGNRISRLDELIKYMKSKDDIQFETLTSVAEDFRDS